MWHKLTITNPKDCDFEYLNAFSLPVDGKVLMIPRQSDRDLFMLDLATMSCERIKNQEDVIERYASGTILPGTPLEFQGKKYELIGLYGGWCLHQTCYGEKIEITKIRKLWSGKFDHPLQLTVTTLESKKTYRGNHVSLDHEIKTLLKFQWEGWTWDLATFTNSNCGDYILLGNAMGLKIFKRDLSH